MPLASIYIKRNGPHRKRRVQQFFSYCTFFLKKKVTAHVFMSPEPVYLTVD